MLQPGADASLIRLQFRGAERVRLTPEGDLSVESAGARFVQKRPVIYQQDARTGKRRPVQGHYQLLAGGVVGLRLRAYDRSLALTIDPVLTFSSFVGGGATDVITTVQSNALGPIVGAGSTPTTDLVPTPDSLQVYETGGVDCFVAILDPS